MWYGGARDRNNEDALPNLPRIRKFIMEGKLREAEEIASMTMAGLPEAQRHYVPLGELQLSLSHHDGPVEDYVRELDLDRGVSRVSYQVNNIRYSRELFASHPDQAIILRISSDTKNAVSIKARFNRQNWRYMEKTKKWDQGGLIMLGECGGKEGSSFAAVMKAVPNEGSCRLLGEYLLVEGATSVTLMLAAGTTFRQEDPESH
ncbi:glycoside hydrolase family 95 protein, partial [Bacillus subtilis]|uniref:glycoside hydrolase family 95 protein n=3 Tax=Bacillales TaxID=1385 RepID=UPI003F7C4AA9